MPNKYQFDTAYQSRFVRVLQFVRIDPVLLFGLLMLTLAGLGILYSAGDQSAELMQKQAVRLSIAFLVMLVVAQIPPQQLYLWTPWVFAVGVILLLMVFFAGEVGKGLTGLPAPNKCPIRLQALMAGCFAVVGIEPCPVGFQGMSQ